MTKINTIYVDMDGDLSDFEGRMFSLYGKIDSKNKHKVWKEFIEKNNFETLDMLMSAPVLLNYLNRLDVNIEILSSAGGPDFYDEVSKQKSNWLKKHNINYKKNIVVNGFKKSDFAKADTILIDDTPRVVDNFKNHGGHVLLHDHRDVYKTIDQLRKFFT